MNFNYFFYYENYIVFIYLFFGCIYCKSLFPERKSEFCKKSTEELDSTKKMAIGAYLVIYYEETGMVYLITTECIECNCVI